MESIAKTLIAAIAEEFITGEHKNSVPITLSLMEALERLERK